MSATSARAIIATITDFVKRHRGHLYVAGCLALVGWSAYNLGVIRSHHGAAPLQEAAVFQVRDNAAPPTSTSAGRGSVTPTPDHSDPRVVVSKTSSSHKYHYSWCSGAKTISATNQVWFASAGEAEARGYTLAGNCKL